MLFGFFGSHNNRKLVHCWGRSADLIDQQVPSYSVMHACPTLLSAPDAAANFLPGSHMKPTARLSVMPCHTR